LFSPRCAGGDIVSEVKLLGRQRHSITRTFPVIGQNSDMSVKKRRRKNTRGYICSSCHNILSRLGKASCRPNHEQAVHEFWNFRADNSVVMGSQCCVFIVSRLVFYCFAVGLPLHIAVCYVAFLRTSRSEHEDFTRCFLEQREREREPDIRNPLVLLENSSAALWIKWNGRGVEWTFITSTQSPNRDFVALSLP
jgi:hypothetical protein